jgi:hypothetical protein
MGPGGAPKRLLMPDICDSQERAAAFVAQASDVMDSVNVRQWT